MLALASFATTLGAVWWHFDWLEISDDERAAYDDGIKKFTGKDWFPWGKVKRSDDVLVVAIDDKTFTDVAQSPGFRMEYGTWPYDRRIYADAFDYVHSCGAKLVLFDAFMDDPKGDGSGDLALAQAITDRKLPFYLGVNLSAAALPLPKVDAPVNHLGPLPPLTPAPSPAAPAAPGAEEEFPSEEFPEEGVPAAVDAGTANAEAAAQALLAATQRMVFPVEFRGGLEAPAIEGEDVVDLAGQKTGQKQPKHPSPPVGAIGAASAGLGLVISEEDEDGKLRKTRFAYTDGTNTYVTLPVAAAADVLGAESLVLEPGKLTLGKRTLGIDRDGSAWIDYGGTLKERYRSISLVNVLKLRERKEGCDVFKGKYVFVGAYATGTGDSKATPLESSVPGVAKQLAVFDNLVHGQFITDAPFWVSLLFTFLVCLFSVALVLVVRNVFVDIGWPVLLWAGFFLVTGSVLALTKVHVLSALPSFAGTIASVLATAWERLFAGKERERMKEMFQAYMETGLVERMVEGDELPKLDGEEMEVTAFFSDIRGFSSFSERFRSEPKGLMRLLNRYLSTVTPTLTKEGACIDKYIGDAVVALFGAPVRHEDHALRACRAALQAQAAVATLRDELKKEGLPDVYTRMGLNTDRLLVGNIGSEQLLDYTAIGDGMNLAARLEAANKHYGTLILMGENTYLAAKDAIVAREVDLVRVAGKHLASRIYELVGLQGAVPAARLEVLELYADALALYRVRRFAEAKDVLVKALELQADDGPSLHLVERCVAFLQSPPPADWDGVSDLEK